MKAKLNKKNIVALILLLIPVLLIGVSNFFFSSVAGYFDGVLMTFLICITITLIWYAGLYFGYTDRYIESLIKCCKNIIKGIKENPKKVLLHIGILLVIAVLSLIIELFFTAYEIRSLGGIIRVLFLITAGTSVYFIVIFRKSAEKLFLSLSLLIGFMYVAASPLAWYGWDSRIHYVWSLEESFAINVSVTETDLFLSRIHELHPFSQSVSGTEKIPGLGGLSDFSSGRYDPVINTFRKGSGTISEIGSGGRSLIERVAHIPAGLMIFIGRSLVLSPILIIKLGALGNHLVFTSIVYLAIKRLNSGKHLMAVIAMFPAVFSLSTTFGYDWWVIAFTLLGFAYFFYEIQEPDKEIELKNIIIMITAFVFGLGPKAVYVPLMLLLFFIKKRKFKTEKGYKLYLTAVTLSILILLAGFVIPFISSGGEGAEDFRGSPDVNASEQISYILQNPLEYAKTLLNFMRVYMNVLESQNFITSFAYLGFSSSYYFILTLMGFVALTDRNEKDITSSTAGYKVLVSFIVFSTVALFSTALYVGFTGVGADHILGENGRYLLPVVFPFFYIVGSFRIQNKINTIAYSCTVFGIASYFLLAAAWDKLIPGT